MPLPWFRRRNKQEHGPAEDAAPETQAAEAAVAEVAPAGEGAEKPRPKRRRGSRGGRARKRTPQQAQQPAAAKQREQPPAAPLDEEKPAKPRRPTRRRASKRAPLPAAKREILVSVDVGEQRVAILEDGRVAEVYLERPERRSITGNIYKGIVDNVLPGMEAAFIEVGLEKNGFLYVDEIVVPELEGKRHGKRIQDLLSRGQEILVQAVKDPMKTKGARLTTEISLPGRFVVYVPQGEGIGVSRRVPDEERARLRDILKALDVREGGVIVRTAAEGASADDIERDLVFLQRLWKSIRARADQVKGPTLVYQEAELPLRVVRDLFAGDFERALVDHDRTLKRIVGYLKKTSPHMAERVARYRETPPLFEAYGVDAEIRSTLNRRIDLPSGGYLVFDYAEAFTVIDVNTGRFVGSRSKTSTQRLEDTITKNNLEAVKEVVRQLRLRDIGGIIVIDFIDMANPKNRQMVEEALQKELQRDRTKTYVVEISPLGLVEMTRQNVTDGPREILTKKCTACAGDGIVLSESSAAVDAERRLRALGASKPRSKAFRVELNAKIAALLIGPAAERLAEIEAATRRRFLLEGRDDVPLEHFVVLGEGTVAGMQPDAPVTEGQELELKLVEVGLHDAEAGVAKLDGFAVCVGGAAKLVGKKVKARVERVMNGTAYATLVDATERAELPPITAEAEAEKPTRRPPARRAKPKASEPEEPLETEAEAGAEAEEPAAEQPKRKRTRRSSRGGRGRRKKAPTAAEAPQPDVEGNGSTPPETVEAATPTIHVPELGAGDAGGGDGAEPQKPRKRTRRGSRGGRSRRRKAAAAVAGRPAEDSRPAEGEPSSGDS